MTALPKNGEFVEYGPWQTIGDKQYRHVERSWWVDGVRTLWEHWTEWRKP